MNKVVLNLGGKEREGNLGLGFLARIEDKEGLNITDLLESFQKKPLSALPTLMFHSLAYGEERVGNKVEFTKYNVIDWIDEDGGLNSPETVKFSDAFAKSITYKTDQQSDGLGKQRKARVSK
ncbi:hypothetical protein [Elizabethkingia anophelis]|uniref:hypothetical protein n=1 Tax=Elizabethkingia anophelis TaxID=1117645 RepID=UPI000750C186|nr:hypothetical protein [Elizabethkingia anophelis]AQW91331.1 hypothetical protein BBD28_11985 [Elizabethkingia anophelis]KUY14197.1 hypothetical protein ATB94_09365 [Elizabethkingia anophelis]